MQTNNRLFDDLAKMANGALSAASGVRSEFEQLFRAQIERLLNEMDLVPREEFDAVKAMASKAREEQEKLEARVVKLEKALAAKQRKSVKKTPAKPKAAAKPAEKPAE